eukprot:TRINITY_DN2449_c0_g2_i1.p1 TRINITY_DN2449_c0_g2~~TRINITY_DN2449_c0_g2_i1.p1  ORF type:complete len:824 (+),score=298.90 TRINITY_DN2449_c0_g2_i1:73-2472(+)
MAPGTPVPRSPQVRGSPKAAQKTQTGNVQVMVRVRPFSKREKEYSASRGEELRPILSLSGNRVAVLDPENDYQEKDAFEYDEAFWSCVGYPSDNEIATQHTIYEKTGRPMLESALAGYNCCVFAYGQTGAGKTFTMLGSPDQPGVSYMLIDDLFAHIDRQQVEEPGTVFKVEISFLEIYNEQCRDLFNKQTKAGQYSDIKIRQDPVKGIVVQGLITREVHSSAECAKEMERGVDERALAETKMNATSSRSHAICQISIQLANGATGLRRNALINLVDLAGSERLKMSGVEGAAAKEAKNINLSLSTLRKVFDVLIANSKRKRQDVPPYRESMLTWVLRESLGGNSKTLMIAAVSPHVENMEDTMSTLRYALKAKAIVCKVICNEQPSAKMVSGLRDQVAHLEALLAAGQGAQGGLSAEERKEMEEQIAANQKALEDAQELESQMKARHEALEQEVRELELQRAEMHHQMSAHKKQKFAAAFRSAFVIKQKKTEGAQVAAEMDDLRARCAAGQDREKDLQEELRRAVGELDLVRRQAAKAERDLQQRVSTQTAQLMERDLELSTLRVRARELEPLCSRLRDHCAEQGELMQQLQRHHVQLQAEHDRVLRELQLTEERLGKRLEEARREVDGLLLRKEHYKKQCISLQMLHEADSRIIDTIRADRRAAADAARSAEDQQRAAARSHLSATSPALSAAMEQARRIGVELEQQEAHARSLSASLGEYRSAAAGWAAGSSQLRGDLRRAAQLPGTPALSAVASPQRHTYSAAGAAVPASPQPRGALAPPQLAAVTPDASPRPHR